MMQRICNVSIGSDQWMVVTCKVESLLVPEKVEFVPDKKDHHGQARNPIL